MFGSEYMEVHQVSQRKRKGELGTGDLIGIGAGKKGTVAERKRQTEENCWKVSQVTPASKSWLHLASCSEFLHRKTHTVSSMLQRDPQIQISHFTVSMATLTSVIPVLNDPNDYSILAHVGSPL